MKFTQLPGTLDIEFVVGDEVGGPSIDFDRDLTGYTFEAPIYVTQIFATGVGGTGSSEGVGETVTNWAINVVSAADGTLALGLTEAQTSLLSPGTLYRWYLRWVDPSGYTRTVLSGTVTARSP